MQILITIALIIIGVLLFELIIFSHEFGHFITAKLSGVKVNEFALGMGPKLFGFKKGETQYCFRLFPVGGFCAMEGEDEDSDEPRAFNNAKVWKRMIIVVAGAVMNILLGILLMFIFVVQINSFSTTTIDEFVPDSYSANSGLEAGDTIVDINGYSVWNSRDLSFGLATLECQSFDGKSVVVYKQDCAINTRKAYASIINDNKITDEKLINKLYDALIDGCNKINKATDKSQAKSYMDTACKDMYSIAGIIDYDLPEIIEKDERKRFAGDVTVIRDGKEVLLEDVQFYTYYADENAQKEDKPSVAFDFYVFAKEKTVGTVLSETFSQTASVGKMVWTSLTWILQGKFSFNDLSGPVGIATAVTHVASQGLETSFIDAVNNILFVMILITINLGMFNMLPFPALDGGRFVFLLIEGIFRKPIPRKYERIVNTAGLILLLGFMAVVSVKDVWQLLTGTMFK
ncbi:MAG: RIP metalloprotease RseP [Ruminococcus sp.]|nr:RIP metalloprotease RseP [Ruminococcus sp.]